jgi:hypothetical protein
MAAYTAKRFGGSTPRMAPHLLGEDIAGVALDCKLWHGTLASWREPRVERTVAENIGTTFLYDCCWLDFEGCVDVAAGPVNCRKLFLTGLMDYPVVMEFGAPPRDTCTATTRRLGVPCGEGPLSAVYAVPAGDERDTEARSYAYQYVNGAGEKGALSQGTPPDLVMREGSTILLSGWPIPDASWGITHVLIYRTVSGYQPPGKESGNVLDTTWMLVAKVAIGAVSFADNIPNELLIEALQEDVAPPPPAGLQGIVHIESMNTLAGFVGKRIYYSENNSYHQWPYYQDLDDNILGLVESNGTIYVATDGAPYVISGAVDCKNAGCREVVRLPVILPMAGGGNRRMAATPQGAVYPGHDGLVQLAGRSSPALLTHPLYAPDDWHALAPNTIIPVVHSGSLFVFGQGGAFVLKLPGGAETGWALDMHSSLSDTNVRQAQVTRNGALFLRLTNGKVVEWDRGDTLRPHKWMSPVLVSDTSVNFGAAHLQNVNGSESVTIAVDRRQPFQRDVLSPRVFRLPTWMLGTRWQVTLEGTATVSLFSMATSMKELGS